MVNSARGSGAAALLIVALFASPAAYAAAEDSAVEKPVQAAPDDRTYLPPWMQNPPVSAAAGAPLKEGAPTQTAQTADTDAAKKAKSPQGHRRRDWPGGALFRGVAEMFGR